MATINTQIGQVLFSCQLPEKVSITTVGESAEVEVAIEVNSVEVFSVVLNATDYKVYLYDIRSIIEDAIRENDEAFGDCDINVTENGTSTGANGFTVVLSDMDIPNAATWLQSHFLTTRVSQCIAADGRQCLSFFATQGEQITYIIDATVRQANGYISTVRWTERNAETASRGQYSEVINVADIITHFAQDGQVLAFTVQRGAARLMKFFVVDIMPQLTLLFSNNFNVWEYAYLNAATVQKRKLEAGEAVSIRHRLKFDLQIEEEFEVETAILSREEAQWLAQMLTSRYIEKIMPDGSSKTILVDGETEISDADDAQNRLKFSYIYCQNIIYD